MAKIRATIYAESMDDARTRIDEFLAGLDRAPDLLLVGHKLHDLLVSPKTFRKIKVRRDNHTDWDVTPMRRLPWWFEGHTPA